MHHAGLVQASVDAARL